MTAPIIQEWICCGDCGTPILSMDTYHDYDYRGKGIKIFTCPDCKIENNMDEADEPTEDEILEAVHDKIEEKFCIKCDVRGDCTFPCTIGGCEAVGRAYDRGEFDD
jgi:hypothetical protein